ncbi:MULTISPECIES: hypothetical protein [Bacillales]|uniref:hypothetical protein n=1 Tax=Bacillales TaxID=1385 RepID=UPI000543C3F0|nr:MULTISPECIES: hypothetical protein [Bacillales]KHF30132.1 hypothetical protein LR68_01259 [Anoxybacillus sp. BCO1]NNU96199.1 hypothetical protein [Anoxybacillus sp. EFIL]NNV04654.1 hypothetical protein [Brevibacillus sp. MCWH]
MKEKLQKIEEIFQILDDSLIKEIIEPEISNRIRNHYDTLIQLGLKDDELISALVSVSVAESIRLGAFITVLLTNLNLNDPFDPRDFIHVVK